MLLYPSLSSVSTTQIIPQNYGFVLDTDRLGCIQHPVYYHATSTEWLGPAGQAFPKPMLLVDACCGGDMGTWGLSVHEGPVHV